MDRQPPYEDWQQPYTQPEQYQRVQHQKQPRTHWQWYRLRTRKVKVSLLGRTLISVLLFCLSFSIVSGCGNQTSTKPISRVDSSATPVHTPTSIINGGVTPPPSHIFTPAPHSTATPSPTQTQGVASSVPSTVYYGVHVALVNMSLVSTFETDAHKPVAIVMWYQHWGVTDGYQYFQPAWMNAVRAHGSIPLVTWDPWDPTLGANQPSYALQNIINGNFDTYIVKWAQASKAWGHPYFLRFAHEMNGNWNPWSEQVNGNKAGQFVLAWRHVHAIFTAQGVTNVTWVWSPNIDFSNSTPLSELYPGDAYVDWGAIDGYNWGNVGAWHVWESFSTLFQQTYQEMLAITSKPLMIGEMASTEQAGNKAAWITDAYTAQIPHYFSRIKAVIWFDQDKETDWRIESSFAAQNAFTTAIQSGMYASNKYASLSVSPIPIP
jgi:glycosyl hydrolase family 26